MYQELEKQFLLKLRTILQSKYLYFFLILFTIIYVAYKNIYTYSSNYKGHEQTIEGTIDYIKIDGNKLSIELKAQERILVNYYIKSEEELANIKSNYQLGDKLLINGVLSKPDGNTVFNLFNYRLYLKSKRIYWLFNATSINKISDNYLIKYKIKNAIISRINKMSTFAYLKAFILGDTSSINPTIKNSYQINGISHLFAISGMHITLFSTLILYLLKKISKNELLNYLIVIIFLVIYAFLAGFSPSILRTILLFILLFINRKLKLNIKTVYLLILVCLFLLIYNPFYIYNLGFIFSFTITLYLIIFSDLINNQKNYINKLLMTSTISFLASLPIVINNFFSVNFLSIILNLIFVTFVSNIVFPLTLIVFLLPLFNPILAILISILENLSLFFSKIKFLNITFCHINIYFIILYYLLITFILYSLRKEKYKNILILIIILFIHHNILLFNKNSIITVLDVGQGDSILIILPHNKGNILIDTGGIVNFSAYWQKRTNEYSIALNITIPYLKSVGVKKLDYLILSHGDYDHMGEAINLVNNFKVDKVVFNADDYNELELELIKILDNKNIRYYKGLKALNINNYKLYFLNTGIYDNENDSSNVIYFNLNNYKFLLMGDAGVDSEKNIIDKYNLNDITFLKVGHHGSNTSSSKTFIDKINPKYSLISVGKNNRYGHPNDKVLDNLSKSKIYRTDLDGSIQIKINKNGYIITTCPP